MVKQIIAAAILTIASITPAFANEYPAFLKPVALSYVNAQGAGLSYNLISLHLAEVAKTPISLNLAPGIVTDPSKGFRVSENVGAYIGVGPLEAGVTKTFSRGFGLSKPLEFSVGFNLFKN